MTEPATNDYRALFDFDVSFLNGGGIQGQDFRLDIEGEEIDDAELAAHIVRELRLLMVGEVGIVNKRVIRERHKGTAVPTAPSGSEASNSRMLVDLSHVVEDGMTTYPGLPAPRISDFLSREQSRSRYEPGTEFQIGLIEMCSNTGTYLDTPFHRYADGHDLAMLPLERVADLEAVVVDVEGSITRAIDLQAFLPYDVRNKAVLIRTGWSRHWGSESYFHNHPFLTEAAALHIVEQKAALVGIDSLNIDDTDTGARPVHSILLAAGILLCEHLTNLDQLPTAGFRFSAVPVMVRGMGTFPVRAYASVESLID